MKRLMKLLSMFVLSIVIMSLIITVFLGFMLGLTHPLPWVIIFLLVITPLVHKKINERNVIRWKASMATGIALIDDDHKKLIQLINLFKKATEYKVSEVEIEKCLQNVVDYTAYHFGREEQLMRLNSYPEADDHQRQHLDMIDKIESLMSDYKINKDKAIDRIYDFLVNWLINHILTTDRHYIPYMKVTALPSSEAQAV
ncbi:MAG: hypothetical protein COA42_11815 [Alteromonadaceae bacterium]|nr:MAG: hypothetical protein COA42_11815 [Alteromonadaceae bacterium]